MGDANTQLTEAHARQLLRRTGFGAPGLDVAHLIGMTRGEAADELLRFTPARFEPSGTSIADVRNHWIKYMLDTTHPVQEKLVLFWHDHFATAYSKVRNASLMGRQNALLRAFCKGNFKDLVKSINRDGAMMSFLDTVANHKQVPNENYARELQELFTLGVKDFSGVSNYTQDDIVQIARAFSGWKYDPRSGTAFLNRRRHDYMMQYPQRGPKVIYRSSGGFGPDGIAYAANAVEEGAGEIDRITDIIFEHRDSEGKVTVARYIARKLLRYFALPGPKRQIEPEPDLSPMVDAVVSESGFDRTWDIGALVRAIFVHDAFYTTAAGAASDPTPPKSIKWPADYLFSTLRLLNIQLEGDAQLVDGGSRGDVGTQLTRMGQNLFEPPSVFGWDWEEAWISSASLLARYGFARDIAAARSGGRTGLRTEDLIDLSLTDPAAIVGAVTDVLGVSDELTDADRAPLIDYLTDNGANPAVMLSDPVVRDTKLNGLFALVLQSPSCHLH